MATERSTIDQAATDAAHVRYGFNATWLPLMVLLPPLVYYLWICAEFNGGDLFAPTSAEDWHWLWAHVRGPTATSVALYGGWWAFQAAMQAWLPGRIHEGAELPDGSRLRYRMNGMLAFGITVGGAIALVAMGWVKASVLYDEIGPLITTANIFTFAFAGYLYLLGRRGRSWEKPSGRPLYDYFMGTRLNPRQGMFDFKLFCEARPGMLLWLLLDLSIAAKQYEVQGHVTIAMALVVGFQAFYLFDYFLHEPAILSTWDIKHEKFGWMLAWGDLVWLPFTYTLQAQVLVHYGDGLSAWAITGIVALNLLGYTIFRGANIQKHRFREDPSRPVWGRAPETIDTERGPKLLVSGWWGKARHINYFGDLLIALTWCLPAGFAHPLPYFHIVYFTILLLHRERRDNAMCAVKYGEDWKRYCARVPWRIVPRIY